MDLKISWWNCRLSPPSTQATKNEPNWGFVLSLFELLGEKGVDVLGLCEVDSDNIIYIKELLCNPEFSHLEMVDLYSKQGNSIEDFCLIYNSSKMLYTGETKNLNTRGPVLSEKLKAGLLCEFLLGDAQEKLFIILCHWQSRNTYHEGSRQRESLGAALRDSINGMGLADKLVIVCGDFNDEPFSDSVQKYLGASRDSVFVSRKPQVFFNPFWNCLGMMKIVEHHPRASGTCYYANDSEFTHWKTFDQIIFSSGFLRDGWVFLKGGAEIVNDIPINDVELQWSEISDHYPVMSHLQRIVQ